jgi:ribosomal protein L16/L10AE
MLSFIPKISKFPKFQKKKIKNLPSKNTGLAFGSFGLKVQKNCLLTSKQLEMLGMSLSKGLKRVGRY